MVPIAKDFEWILMTLLVDDCDGATTTTKWTWEQRTSDAKAKNDDLIDPFVEMNGERNLKNDATGYCGAWDDLNDCGNAIANDFVTVNVLEDSVHSSLVRTHSSLQIISILPRLISIGVNSARVRFIGWP